MRVSSGPTPMSTPAGSTRTTEPAKGTALTAIGASVDCRGRAGPAGSTQLIDAAAQGGQRRCWADLLDVIAGHHADPGRPDSGNPASSVEWPPVSHHDARRLTVHHQVPAVAPCTVSAKVPDRSRRRSQRSYRVTEHP